MQSNATTTSRHHRWLRFMLIALVVLGVVVFLVWPLVGIQLRLSRNGAIAHRLAESLHARFSSVTFRGAASYEREVIYIGVTDNVDEATRRNIEQWLRGQKTEQKIASEIWLRFADDLDDSRIIKI